MGYIYKITNKINNKCYIGSSKKDPKDNWSYYGSGKLIKQAIEKYGKENFTKEILIESIEDIKMLEKQYLEGVDAQHNPQYYNMTNDAIGNNFHSKNVKKSISEKLTGRKLSNKTKLKISKNKTGVRFEGGYNTVIKTKPTVSKAHKGRVSPNKGNSKPVALYKISGEHLKNYQSYTQLALDLNINPETVRCHLIGKANTIYNKQYKAKYI